MLAYLATKGDFLRDASTIEDVIRDAVKAKLNLNVGEREYLSWRNSLGNAMSHVMHSQLIPEDAGIAIEYRVNGRQYRLDFVVSGLNSKGSESLVIIELKQWTDIEFSDLDEHVRTALGGGIRDTRHPSYQAWSYKSHLEQFNEYVYENNVQVFACAYLHNLKGNKVISDSRYENALARAPIFLNGQAAGVAEMISTHISSGPGTMIMENLEASKTRPSKQLADAVGSMLEGQDEFVLIDDQKTVLETILLAAKKSQMGKKRVVIVKGGPGTGKSVISIQALSKLTSERLNVKYVSANAAPRDVFISKLKGILKNDLVKHLFSGSGSFTESKKNTFDALIVDEAHRLKMKSGMYKNLGEDQTKEIINAAKLSVFFIDEAQKVTWSDVGEISRIKAAAAKEGADVEILELISQFRSTGADDYMAWLDNALGVQANPENYFSPNRFDFRVFDSPTELHDAIREKNKENNKSRVVAGYNWDWISQKHPKAMDIVIGDYEAQWNLKAYGNEWIKHPKSIEEVGCIHTCQGLEVDYIGVIVGDDLSFENGVLTTKPSARARTDQSLKGYKKELAINPEAAQAKADELIRNTYRTLMSRGMKGCYVYFTDKAASDYFKSLLPK
jgi:uncharacterized protein